jgi:hypothetical protein
VASPGEVPVPEPTVTIRHRDGTVERRPVQRHEGSFDDWVTSMEAKRSSRKDSAAKVTVAEIDEDSLRVLDLREVASGRHRIVGSANYLTDDERRVHGGTSYLLVREPGNAHDGNAVAVYGRGRKVGYLSAAKAAGLAPMLDGLGFDAYRIGGTTVIENSIRLWADIPTVTAMRAYVKGR